MNLIIVFIYFIWLLSEILLNRLMRAKQRDQPNKDKNSLGLIWVTIFICITLAVYACIHYNEYRIDGSAIKYVGLFVILFGVIIRLIVVRSLGIFFTADVTIRENHALKKDGFYKYLRHPSYFASLISFVGFGFSLNNWMSLLIVVVAILCAFIYRIKVEEKALIEYFGQEYMDYKKSTKAIIPFIY